MRIPQNTLTIGKRFYCVQPEAAMLPYSPSAKDCIPRPQPSYIEHVIVPGANGDYGIIGFSSKGMLTRIQARIFVLSTLGMEVNAIADTFYNSKDTIKVHRRNILDKLDAPDFAGAASTAFGLGMLSIGKGLPLENPIRPREIAALQAGAENNDQQDNADDLGITLNTVKSHRREVFQALNATGMEDAVVLGHLYGVLTPNAGAETSNAA